MINLHTVIGLLGYKDLYFSKHSSVLATLKKNMSSQTDIEIIISLINYPSNSHLFLTLAVTLGKNSLKLFVKILYIFFSKLESRIKLFACRRFEISKTKMKKIILLSRNPCILILKVQKFPLFKNFHVKKKIFM